MANKILISPGFGAGNGPVAPETWLRSREPYHYLLIG